MGGSCKACGAKTSEKLSFAPLTKILKKMGRVEQADALPLLQAIQQEYGYLPKNAVRMAAEKTGISESSLFGIATFYAQFHMEPRGRHTVRVCRGTACYVRGGERILDALEENLGVEDGQTTEDLQFSLESVACLGLCAMAPLVMVDDAYHSKMDARQARKALEQYREEAEK